jgi:hypothetical protein
MHFIAIYYVLDIAALKMISQFFFKVKVRLTMITQQKFIWITKETIILVEGI